MRGPKECYTAYGLQIWSEVALPEFAAGDGGEDVRIRVEGPEIEPPEARMSPWCNWVTRERAMLTFEDGGRFLIRGGREIVIQPEPNARWSRLRLCLTGMVMAVLLYQRGRLVLHASAMEVDGEGVAFLANSGGGKSTLAAALHARGHRLLADDVSPVHFENDAAWVVPAFSRLKLDPAVAKVLPLDTAALSPLDLAEEKHGYTCRDHAASRPAPLTRVYLLSRGAEMRIESLPPGEAVMALVQHSYPSVVFHSGGEAHFRQCVELARRAQVFRLYRTVDLAALRALADAVARHGKE